MSVKLGLREPLIQVEACSLRLQDQQSRGIENLGVSRDRWFITHSLPFLVVCLDKAGSTAHPVERRAVQQPRSPAAIHCPAPRYKVNRGLTVAQAKATLKAAASRRLGALYVLALFLGLRRGELLGLRWQDVDLDEARLEVVQTLQRVGGSLRLVPPKTKDSARTVPLPAVCVEALREHKKRQFAERADAWPDWEDHGLVFPSRRGTPMEPDNLRQSWSVIRNEAELGAIRFHDLRHTCVTLLLDLGTPPHVVREIVGHSDIEVTMTIYAHVSLDDERAALRKLGEALG
jgi:integrase